MSLFQKPVEQKYLNQLDARLLDTKYTEFQSYFGNPAIQENIRNSKEEQFQEGFLRELFVKILGYTLNPSSSFNLTTEYKNIKDSKKADGAVIIEGVVKAVIELEGTNATDLGKIEAQAFGYKNNQPHCMYVITSNFEKLRFYIDNAIEHIEFNLFMLSRSDFGIFYLCLAYDNIANGIPKKIKDESVSQEDVITKKLYQDYSLFKRELHQNLVIRNPPYVQSNLLSESEKQYIYLNYKTAEYQINTYGIFVEKFLSLLKYNSIYSLIIPNYWLSTKYDKKLRKEVFINNHALEVINTYQVFESATVDTLILTGRKVQFDKQITRVLSISNNFKSIDERLNAINLGLWSFNGIKEISNDDDDVLMSFNIGFKLKGEMKLGDFFSFKKGMQPYEEGKGTPPQTREMMDNRIYHSTVKLDESYFPLLGSKHIKRYYLLEFDEYIKYGKNLAAPRNFEIFKGERVLINRILSKDTIDGVFLSDQFINNTDVFNLIPFPQNTISIKVLYALILSKLCATYFKKSNVNLNREAFPKINVNTLESFPVPKIELLETQVPFIEKADLMLSLNKELQEASQKFQRSIQRKFGLQVLPNKLQDWYLLTYAQFIAELGKKKEGCRYPRRRSGKGILCRKLRKHWS